MKVQEEYDTVIQFPTALRMEATVQGITLQDHCYNAGHRANHCILFRYRGDRELAKAQMQSFVELHLGAINVQFYAERDDSSQCYVKFDVRGWKK